MSTNKDASAWSFSFLNHHTDSNIGGAHVRCHGKMFQEMVRIIRILTLALHWAPSVAQTGEELECVCVECFAD